ncbi:hypothetical protein LTR56_007921 [Elasticomyces elasticus]|nr:hypothetical protein LTR22_022536 [Elasticomyces elasticus]KAK3647692.1 hypothetical protein LTR56_007921 [Elasticomyces elasticus]KAK4908109.1 hypothetical protein LTR49_022943 [Elasticomyces elasticus]KAK5738523.1 hypothetical protein LTS12_025564 [Elasticomyces elasticus]
MATAAAFAVVELLESVLINLDFHDLLAARSVSRNWRNVISQSLPIKQILFLAPTSDGPIGIDLPGSVHALVTRGPILAKQPSITNPLFPRWSIKYGYEDKRCLSFYEYLGSPNVWVGAHYDFNWTLTDMQATSKGQFYRNMFLTQPACTAVLVEIAIPATRDCYERQLSDAVLRVDDGIRLGDIVGTVEQMMKSYDGVREGLVVKVKFATYRENDSGLY